MKIFLSSTYIDLIDIRKVAINYLDNIMGCAKDSTGKVIAMEFFNASENTCLEECIQELNSSDLVLGIYGERYGSIDTTTNLSITELEFDYAISRKIPILAFILRTDKREEKEEKFIRDKVYSQNTSCAHFQSCADFIDRLDNSLKSYFGSIDGYSFDSLWSKVRELQQTVRQDIEKGTPGFEGKIVPFISGDEESAIDSIISSTEYIRGYIDSLLKENDAVYNYAYNYNKFRRTTDADQHQLIINVKNAYNYILSNKVNIEFGLRNHTTRIILASMFLKLYNMQITLLHHRWSETLRKQAVKLREEYIKTIKESHLLF